MKAFYIGLVAFFLSSQAFAKVSILDKQDGTLELTDSDAAVMTKVILKSPVIVTSDSYELTLISNGKDFHTGKTIKVVTGKIACLQDGSSCIVKGSQIRESGDDWFSPEIGIARVFGMEALMALATPKSNQLFHCEQVYGDIACDFELR